MSATQATEHVHQWTRHQNVTSKGYVMPAYEVCECGAARTATDQSAEGEPMPTTRTDQAIPLRFAQHLAHETITPRCEVTGDGPSGECPEDAVAIRWEGGFADSVCQRHAETATERGAVVVYAKRHSGED